MSLKMCGKIKVTVFLFVLFFAALLKGEKASLTSLGEKPDWSRLDVYQETITRDEFLNILQELYAPGGTYKDMIRVLKGSARIWKDAAKTEYYEIRFAKEPTELLPIEYWNAPKPWIRDKKRLLEGVHIALDPGHIGGAYSEIENRHFVIEGSTPVKEGDMTLLTAEILKGKLEQLGAKVTLTRKEAKPVTAETPRTLLKKAYQWQGRRRGKPLEELRPEDREELIYLAKLLFYQVSEIRTRAEVVNKTIQPDMVLCLHFNAAPWPDPRKPSLTKKNHTHFLINGVYSEKELAYEDMRFEMLVKLLNRSWIKEKSLAQSISLGFAYESGLPAFTYRGNYARNVENNPFVWARNLIANRMYECPVVFMEPYVANGEESFERIQLGHYEGKREVRGELKKSIFAEYADAVVHGLKIYFGDRP